MKDMKAGWLFEPKTMTLTVTGGWFRSPHVVRCSRDLALLKGTYETADGKKIPINQRGVVPGGKNILLINKKDNGTWPMFLGRFVGSVSWEVDAGFCQYVTVEVDYSNGWREPVVRTRGI